MNVHVVDHPLIAHKLTMMRDKTCNSKNFRELLGEIASLMTYDVTKNWETEPFEIETPLEKMTGTRLKGEVTIIPILRAGLGLLNGVLAMIPHAHVGHIGLYRDPETHKPVEYYCGLPKQMDAKCIVVDPMLATGSSAHCKRRVKRIIMSNNSEVRPDWDHYFMEIAQVVSKRSTCLRRSVGAVIVKNKQILATGYNGTPKGMPHCGEVGCLREQLHVPSGKNHELCRGIHAEQNAVVQAAVHGVSVEGGTLYCTNQPCVVCTKILINAGIERIVFKDPYPDKLAEDMLAGSGIQVEVLDAEQK